MKAFISRFKGNATPPPSRPSSSASGGKENVHSNGHGGVGSSKRPMSVQKTSSDPQSVVPLRSSTPLSTNEYGAGPSRQKHATRNEEDGGGFDGYDGRTRTVSASGEGKKVTFRSPAPTPTTSIALNDVINTTCEPTQSSTYPSRASSPDKQAVGPRPSAPSRSSTAQSYSSKRSLSTRKSYIHNSSQQSPTSPTESDGSLSAKSYLPPPNSWSEMAADDLIANIGPRERTRQEVLYEIVSSEERYVQELIKLNETFSKTLLPPSVQSPSLNLFGHTDTLSRTLSPSLNSPKSPTDSFDSHLPIAAKYSSSSSRHTGLSNGTRSASGSTNATTISSDDTRSPTEARMIAYNILTNGRPSHKTSHATLSQARSHHSLPPPPRNSQPSIPQNSFSATYSRMSHQPGRLGKQDKRTSTQSVAKPIELPEELENVLAVLSGGILEGHIKLAAALKKRYDNQYPLVRSLADVFTAHSYILREYATYVLHLERALAIVDDSLSLLPANTTSNTSKRQSKRIDESPALRLSYLLHSLEELAAQKGESGLAISLSKPFQRLLKYPLLFQNLLFNTDPSLKEYEATLAMVDEVEMIVRTIEDKKSSSEEREKTRDVWARIEGLEKDKVLMAPKPNRLIHSETQLPAPETASHNENGGQRKSFKRLSDILSRSDHHDLWVVRFNDVSLLCEKTGSTNLPIHRVKNHATRSESLNDMSRKERQSTGRRAQSMRSRNLYKFIKVHEWHLRPRSGSTEGLLDMKAISEVQQHSSRNLSEKSRLPDIPVSPDTTPRKPAAATKRPNTPPTNTNGRHLVSDTTPTKIPLKNVDGPSPHSLQAQALLRRETDTETLVSDRQSVMSFAFKGADQIRPVQRRVRAPQTGQSNANGTGQRNSGGSLPGPGSKMSHSAANAKFAHRLRSPETVHEDYEHPHLHSNTNNDHDQMQDKDATVRPHSSKTRRSLPPAMALSPSTNLPEQSLRNGTLLNPPRIVSHNTPSASAAIRGASGKGSSASIATGPIPGRNISAATAKRLSMKAAELARSGTPESSALGLDGNDSSMALWAAYGAANGNGNGNGSEVNSPRRVVAGASSRHMGGRI